MPLFTENAENAAKSREWQLENELNLALRCLQHIVIAENTAEFFDLVNAKREAGQLLTHWLENLPDYLQAPEWNEPTAAAPAAEGK